MRSIFALLLAILGVVLVTNTALAEDPVRARLPSLFPHAVPSPDVGKLSTKTLERVVLARRRSVAMCYERSLKHDRTLSGRVMVLVTLKPSGKVAKTSVASRRLAGTPVAKCIERAVAKWRFPAFAGPLSRDILLPFRLRRG